MTDEAHRNELQAGDSDMSRLVDRLLQWAARGAGSKRKRLPPAPPIVLGHLWRQRAGRAPEFAPEEQRERFIKDAGG